MRILRIKLALTPYHDTQTPAVQRERTWQVLKAAFSGRYAGASAVCRENRCSCSVYTKADAVSIPVIATRFSAKHKHFSSQIAFWEKQGPADSFSGFAIIIICIFSLEISNLAEQPTDIDIQNFGQCLELNVRYRAFLSFKKREGRVADFHTGDLQTCEQVFLQHARRRKCFGHARAGDIAVARCQFSCAHPHHQLLRLL